MTSGLPPLYVKCGGTSSTTLTSNNFLIATATDAIGFKGKPNGTVIGTTDTQTMSNKTFIDASNGIVDGSLSGDQVVVFDLSNIPTSTTVNISFPSATDTLLGVDTIQTVSNKNINASNTINPSIFSSPVPVSKGGTGASSFTTNNILIGGDPVTDSFPTVQYGGTGVTSFTAGNFLQGNGTGAILDTTIPPIGDLVTTLGVQTLSNKTFDSSNSIYPSFSSLVPIIKGGTGTGTLTTGEIMVGGISVSTISVLPVSKGGTNITSLSANEVLLGGATITTTSIIDVNKGGTGNSTFVTTPSFYTIPTGNGTGAFTTTLIPNDFITTNSVSTLENKTLVADSTEFSNIVDNTKKMMFDCSSITTGTTIDITLINGNTTLVGTNNVQIIRQKIFDSSNTISPTSFIGTSTSVTKGFTGNSTLTSGNILQGNGTGAILSALSPPSSAIVGIDDIQTLTNKTVENPLYYFLGVGPTNYYYTFDMSGFSASTTYTFNFPDMAAGITNIVDLNSEQTLTNTTIPLTNIFAFSNQNTSIGLGTYNVSSGPNSVYIGSSTDSFNVNSNSAISIGANVLSSLPRVIAVSNVASHSSGGILITPSLTYYSNTDDICINGGNTNSTVNNIIVVGNSTVNASNSLRHIIVGSNSVSRVNDNDTIIIGNDIVINESVVYTQSQNGSIYIGNGITKNGNNSNISDNVCIGNSTISVPLTTSGTISLGNGNSVNDNSLYLNGITTSNTANVGAAAALPSNPNIYLLITINGTPLKLPLYNI